ncbi:uncharacterized protein LOC121999324 [Zingiber officinale]|uniref:uncharacterized protein LOC121999324 n=1 Tax=Zingiber officinale TaxID=94328 RepID=UPI001C4AF246|nr:uncharacterized protein LOC121999324 [Zingiber officinale]
MEKKAEKSILSQLTTLDFEDIDPLGDDIDMDNIGAKGVPPISTSTSSRSVNMQKRPRQIGPMDTYFAPNVQKIVESRKGKERQSTINEAYKKELREKACMTITEWMYDAAIPFNVVNYSSFKRILDLVGQYGIGLKGPSYHEVRVPFLKKAVDSVTNDYIKSYETEWAKYGCSLMADGWTDKRQRTLINFLVNSPKGSVFIESVDASDYAKTGENIFQLLDRFVEQDIGKLHDFKATLKKAMSVNAYIYVRPGMVNMLRQFTRQKELCRASVTRFATAFLTLERMHLQKQNLRKMFISKDWAESKWAKGPAGKKIAKIIMTLRFWSSIVHILKKYSPLVRVLRLVDGERKPAMGYIYEAMDRIHSKKRNRLTQQRLNDLVFVKYNHALKLWYDARDKIAPISLTDIDDSNEWASGAEEPEYCTRGKNITS